MKEIYHLFILLIGYVSADTGCNDPTIEILISPMMSRHVIRQIELLWNMKDADPKNDWVALYDADPSINNQAKPLFRSNVRSGENWVKTDIQESHNFTTLPFYSVCLGYWAVYWRRRDNENTRIAYSCLKTFPTWMEDSQSEIENLKIKDVNIPGTHNSAAYITAHHSFKESVFQKYVYTQDEDIMNQLIMGARYLDVRVGLYKGVYWVNHGEVSLQQLSDVLDVVKKFIDHTNEIIIIDFHRFPVGFNSNSELVRLATYIVDKLQGYLTKNIIGAETRLQDIWQSSRNSKKRIIVSFNNDLIVHQFKPQIWPKVSHVWADTHNRDKLISHLSRHMVEGNTNHLWAAMAELTPSAWSLVKYRKGLREMAYTINKDITTLFQGSWGKHCNIVAVDFLRSTGIVLSAIKWNKCRAKI